MTISWHDLSAVVDLFLSRLLPPCAPVEYRPGRSKDDTVTTGLTVSNVGWYSCQEVDKRG